MEAGVTQTELQAIFDVVSTGKDVLGWEGQRFEHRLLLRDQRHLAVWIRSLPVGDWVEVPMLET
jgi:hypothetical protein